MSKSSSVIAGLDRAARRAFYRAEILRYTPKYLSQVDRCPLSATSGSADREFWAWATKDFSNMDMQRGVRLLAFLFARPFPGNGFCRQSALMQWIEQLVKFWAANQAAGGAFDHLYPYEKSWMAAAFTLTDMAAAFDLVGMDVTPETRTLWLDTLRKAAIHLVKTDEKHAFISNHRSAAAAGLAAAARIFGDNAFVSRSWSVMHDVYRHQSPEGWYEEYGGADPGYQTLDIHYQGVFYRETGETRVVESVTSALDFTSYFVHPDGSIGGEYGSRACPQFFPGGFEVFAPLIPIAEAMIRRCCAGLANGTSAGLQEADGRNEVPMAASYVLALEVLDSASSSEDSASSCPLPIERRFQRAWPAAGMMVRNDGRSYVIVGASKGGVIKVFDLATGALVHASCGYAGRTDTGLDITTHHYTSSPDFTHRLEEGERPIEPEPTVVIKAPFFVFRRNRVMSPFKFLLFRIFNNTVGRIALVNNYVRHSIIVNRFIVMRRKENWSLIRKINFYGDRSITISDHISGDRSLTTLREFGFLSTIYMASAKYYRPQDIHQAWMGEDLGEMNDICRQTTVALIHTSPDKYTKKRM